jgi:hypothetical protein
MSDKKQTPSQPNRPALEHYRDSGIAILKRDISESNSVTISQRVPITPAPARPPERDKK